MSGRVTLFVTNIMSLVWEWLESLAFCKMESGIAYAFSMGMATRDKRNGERKKLLTNSPDHDTLSFVVGQFRPVKGADNAGQNR